MTGAEQSSSEFARAASLHQQGRLNEAIPIYEAVLRASPRHAGAANLLGVALMQMNRFEEALEAIRKALRADPNQPSAHYNIGAVLQTLNRHDEAIDHYRKALALKPDDPQAYNNLGVALNATGRLDEAAKAFERATVLEPRFAEAHSNLAAALARAEKFDEAVKSGKQAIALNPALVKSYYVVANALHSQGKSLEALEVIDRAIKTAPNMEEGYLCAADIMMAIYFEDRAIPHLREALRINPAKPSTYFKLAICLYVNGKSEEANKMAERGFALGPASAVDEISAAVYLQHVNRLDEALLHFEKGFKLAPDSLLGRSAYAMTLNSLRRSGEAVLQFDEILKKRPDEKEFLVNRSLAALSAGNFREGWKWYDKRLSADMELVIPGFPPIPRWDGKSRPRKLMVWGEQGIGDQILYASILPDVIDRADSVVLKVEPRLVPIFARSFPSLEVYGRIKSEEGADSGAQISLGELGKLFRHEWKDFPRHAYLTADETRVKQLQNIYFKSGNVVIGISWRSAAPRLGGHKTAKLRDFASNLPSAGCDLVDLQYGDTSSEIAEVRAETGAEVRHIDEIDNMNDIDGLAALVEACDCIVTVSNTTAHIAGALGKPVWILVPHGQGRHWYWFQDRKDSPWYPGARIVRQQPGQTWADVVASIEPEISEFARELKAGR